MDFGSPGLVPDSIRVAWAPPRRRFSAAQGLVPGSTGLP